MKVPVLIKIILEQHNFLLKTLINKTLFSINSDVNEDDEKILNPLIPQKHFGNKNKNKKKFGKITGLYIIQNNNNKNKNKSNGIKKDNPWFKLNKSKSDNVNYNNKTEEKSVINPLEQFDISKTDVGLDTSMNTNNIIMESNNTFIKEIKSFINKN